MITHKKFDISIKDIVYVFEDKPLVAWEKKHEENSEHVMIYVFNGETNCSINSKDYSYKAGEIVWRLPNSIYSAKSISVPFHYVTVAFTVSEDFDYFGFESWDPIFRDLDASALSSLFNHILYNFVKKDPEYMLEIKSSLLKIISIIVTSKYNHLQQKNVPFVIKPAISHIEKNFLNGNITVDELAKMCCISNKHFSRVFINTYQITPKKYINNLKINYAKNLLETSRMDISKIAENVGFSDVYYFSKTFKSITRTSPYAYRKNYQKSLFDL